MTELNGLDAAFTAAGAEPVDPALLQPAGPLLDLYGEDIRARAYVTQDPDLGEMMLRPDFTVPVAQRHLESGAAEARYSYRGPVFRMPPTGSGRPREYQQIGFELFHNGDPARADTEVFALFHAALSGHGLEPVTGDIGILMAAVQSLATTPRRRRALMRHIWRPRRFRALFERFAGRRPPPVGREEMLANGPSEAPEIGLRRRSEVETRLAHLAEDAAADPISKAEAQVLDAILGLRETMPNAHAALSDICVDLPDMLAAVDRIDARMEAFAAAGLDPETLPFESSFGRTNMEYYDGFVFGFIAPSRPDLPAIATGGRYDALMRVLDPARAQAAIGGVIRPELLAEVAR